MNVGLEKLVQDIKNETTIWPIENSKNTLEEDAAWDRVGARNKMSGNHVKSIFKVLSKKYEVEKLKPKSSWKLFEFLTFLDPKNEAEDDDDDDDDDDVPDDADLDDDGEFVELLEVNEYDESEDDENESPYNPGIEEEEQQKVQIKAANTSDRVKDENLPTKVNNNSGSSSSSTTRSSSHQDKPQQNQSKSKSIEVKKSSSNDQHHKSNTQYRKSHHGTSQSVTSSGSNRNLKITHTPDDKEEKRKQQYEAARNQMQQLQQKKQRSLLSENLKRKLPNDSHSDHSPTQPPHKKETKEYIPPQGLKIERITVNSARKSTDSLSKENSFINEKSVKGTTLIDEPAVESKNDLKVTIPVQISSINTSGNVTNTSAAQEAYQNGISKNIEIKREILENDNESTINQTMQSDNNNAEVLPAFFRDLYNSKQYDCFGMYVASAMNRLPTQMATQLEAKILSAIIEVNSVAKNAANGSGDNY